MKRVIRRSHEIAAAIGIVLLLSNLQAVAHVAYIPNAGSNTVSVVSLDDQKVITTIPVGKYPTGVAVGPRDEVYITNSIDGTVSVIDTRTNALIGAAIPVGVNPEGVAVTPDGSKVYVANANSNTVSVISGATHQVIGTISIPGVFPYGVAITPAGDKVYVTGYYSDNLSVIETATNKVITTIPVGRYAAGIEVSPNGSRVYVADSFIQNNVPEGSVSVISTANNRVVATVDLGPNLHPYGLSITPDGKKVYVTNYGTNNVSVVNARTNSIIGTPVAVGQIPQGISVSPDGCRAIVANYGSNSLSQIATTTNGVVGQIAVGTSPTAFGHFIWAPGTRISCHQVTGR